LLGIAFVLLYFDSKIATEAYGVTEHARGE
jgi:hypothetical protein